MDSDGVAFRALAASVLRKYSIGHYELDYLGHSQSVAFRVRAVQDGQSLVLRIHLPVVSALGGVGSTLRGAYSEMKLLEWLSAQEGIVVPKPLRNSDGETVTQTSFDDREVLCTLLRWLDGETLDKLSPQTSVELAQAWGQSLGRLHRVLLDYPPADGLAFPVHDADELAGDRRWFDGLRSRDLLSDIDAVERGVSDAIAYLRSVPKDSEHWGLIHGDMSIFNTVLTALGIGFIDFGLTGPGFHSRDVATALVWSASGLRQLFLEGYRKGGDRPAPPRRLIDASHLTNRVGFFRFRVDDPNYLDIIDAVARDFEKDCQKFVRGEPLIDGV